jgi:alpha-mannosidase
LPYQAEKIRCAWIRFLTHGFHDDLTGTSIPEAYTYSWNDEIISMNIFDSVIKNAVGGVVRALDTRTKGIPVIIYNPLAISRKDIVEAEINLHKTYAGEDLSLLNEKGQPVPMQIAAVKDDTIKMIFQAEMPPLGFSVYDLIVRDKTGESDNAAPEKTEKNNQSNLENDRYIVGINEQGDISRIFDKKSQKEILSEPIKLELFNDYSPVWPAWEILYKTITAAPRAAVSSPVRIEMVENGPVRSVIEVEREESGSVFKQRIVLPAGEAGDRIEVENIVDWKTQGTLLKASFPLTAKNLKADYNLGMGIIERGNNFEKKYEVPAQHWADITAEDGTYGAAVITDCKYGWDKPKDNELRLSLIHTPETSGSYKDQATQDLGVHRFKYAIAAHKGDWRSGGIPEIADRMNQPLIAFTSNRHKGMLGRSFSFITINGEGIAVKALKQSEKGDGIIVRVQERYGRPIKDAEISFAAPIVNAKEVNGQEERIGDARVAGGKLMFDINPNSPKTFLVTIGKPKVKLEPPVSAPVRLEYNLDAVTPNANMKDGDFDGKGTTFPAELFPESISSDGITFRLGSGEDGKKNALVCKGQVINLPKRDYDRLYILAAAINGDQSGAFSVGGREFELNIQQYNGFIGQWDSRVVNGEVQKEPELFVPAYINKDKLAYVSTHLHKSDGTNIPYSFGYIFEYSLPFPLCAKRIKLPDNENIRIFALTVAKNQNIETEPLQELYDSANGAGVMIKVPERLFLNSTEFELSSNRNRGEVRYTLDGSEPSQDSPLYTSPIRITETTIVKARVFGAGNESENRTASITIEKAALSEAVQALDAEQGLSFEYYEGKWRELKDMLATKPLSAGIAKDFSMISGNPKDYFGYRFKGYIKVEQDGIYKFHLVSDDGSRLIIDDKTVVDNDGLHGAEVRESGITALKAGLHTVELLYFDRGWDKFLTISFTAPDGEKKPVTPAMFYYKRNQ